MGDKVRRPQGWLHGQQQEAKMPQQEYGQRAAGMPQEHQGFVKRPQGQPRVRQERAWVAIELQETQVVAQPPEAKVGGAANPLPQVAEPLQPQAGGPAPPPRHAPIQRTPPNLQAGRILMAQQPLSPPPMWPHLSPGGLPPLPRAGKPALHPSRPGAATPPM